MHIRADKDGFISIEYFKNVIDITKIKWYSLEDRGSYLSLKFYDKNKKVVKPYANEKKNEKAKSNKVKKK